MFLPPGAATQNLVADGGYASLQLVAPPALAPNAPSNRVAIVGCLRKGKRNTVIGPLTVSPQRGAASVLAAVGDGVVNGAHIPYDAVREMVTATPEATEFVFVAARDGSETSATLQVLDGTGFAANSLVVGGTWANGKVLQATITPASGSPVVVNYVAGTFGDSSNATTLQQIANLVNLSPAVTGPSAFLQQIQSADVSATTISLRALSSGTGGNSVGLTTNAPTGMTFVAGGSTFSGGAAAGVIATITFSDPGSEANGATGVLSLQAGTLAAGPVFQYALAYPYNGQQVWTNIVGFATPGGAYDAPAFKANFLAAVNGTGLNAVGSALGVATAGSSTATPLLGVTVLASGGTDGLAGVSTSTLMTAMNALRGTPFGEIIIAGCTDPAVDVVIQAFLDQVGGVGVTAFPSNQSLSSIQAAKTAYALANRRIYRVADWLNAPDMYAAGQASALVSPAGAAAGVIASLEPRESISNKPEGVAKGNVFSTERTAKNNPVDPLSEGASRKLLGVGYFTTGMPRSNGLLGLAHQVMSDGITRCSDVRMGDYLSGRVLGFLVRYVGKNQMDPPAPGTLDPDPIRRLIVLDFESLKAELLNPSDPWLKAFSYAFTATAQQVAQNYCPWSIAGKTLSGIEFAVANIAVGPTVQAAA
jgi:hypothetical protein